MSIEGMRQVTGTLEPAMKGNCISWAMSTIRRAWSQLHERCLSLNTAAVRPLARNTSTVCWKNSQRG